MVMGPIEITETVVIAIKRKPLVNGGRILWAIVLISVFVPLGAIIVRLRRFSRKIRAY